jgi:hypothetical protein
MTMNGDALMVFCNAREKKGDKDEACLLLSFAPVS